MTGLTAPSVVLASMVVAIGDAGAATMSEPFIGEASGTIPSCDTSAYEAMWSGM